VDPGAPNMTKVGLPSHVKEALPRASARSAGRGWWVPLTYQKDNDNATDV
jgi:hypothetical protein